MEKTKQTRKPHSKKEGLSQKSMTFRLDNDNAEWLAMQANKGRYINELIAKDRESNGK